MRHAVVLLAVGGVVAIVTVLLDLFTVPLLVALPAADAAGPVDGRRGADQRPGYRLDAVHADLPAQERAARAR